MTNRGKRELLDDPDQPPQTRANHAQHLQSDPRVLEAKRLEILLADEKKRRIIDGGN